MEDRPKFDWKNLRENYVNGNLFRMGDIVENDNTGLVERLFVVVQTTSSR